MGYARKIQGGIVGFNTLRFNGNSYPFEGEWSKYFVNAPFSVNVYLSDKNESQIAELLQTSPWNSFYNVNYTPIPLTLTMNITFCPQSNSSEDVALYSLDNYASFEDANYDLSNLTLMNYTSHGQYSINKYQSYVLVARYDKEYVDYQLKYNGIDAAMYSFNNMDYFSIKDAQSDMTIDLTFTWKTNSMKFIQVNESPDFSYSIGGINPLMTGTISGPLGTVSGASSGDAITLTLPATHALDKVVMQAGETVQTIAAPEPSNGSYEVSLSVPTEKLAYIYVYWKENIKFADPAVKAICVENWDTNEDGEISMAEAAAATTATLGETFRGNTEITSFDELQYFTGLTSIPQNAFRGDSALKSVVIPQSVTAI